MRILHVITPRTRPPAAPSSWPSIGLDAAADLTADWLWSHWAAEGRSLRRPAKARAGR